MAGYSSSVDDFTSSKGPTGLLENFIPGDLIYGLAGCRNELTDLLKKERPDFFNGGKSIREIFIDDLNAKNFSFFLILNLMQAIGSSEPGYASEKSASQASFFTYMLPIHQHKERIFGNTYRKTGLSFDFAPIIRNGCKYGLLWAMQSSPYRKIHFIISDIDFKKCFSKERGYTNSELRFIYRNRDIFKPFYDSGRLNFYAKDVSGGYIKVQAPWEDRSLNISATYYPKSDASKKSFLLKQETSHKILFEQLREAVIERSVEKVTSSVKSLLPYLQSMDTKSELFRTSVGLLSDIRKEFFAPAYDPFKSITQTELNSIITLAMSDEKMDPDPIYGDFAESMRLQLRGEIELRIKKTEQSLDHPEVSVGITLDSSRKPWTQSDDLSTF